ncbi:hypothetical protein BCR33DRAFT_773790 [Rhizoclosmatium globosum]|uniref:SH3 domain-containing protein n=1 Tax=Rhizoclosmatium globosum TaxID=329046 RepID=A0A1Y2AV61_9FUNG|nr:hypothetical protein BCR33DRAFT_773790 [Rhizoclosmatium globosum]|eukprot:ORY26449.1 hypothetical protein BCR33DRAFT_773790 [Rhizoclosmatium globosum]
MAFDKTQLMKVPTLATAGVAILGWILLFIGICIINTGGLIGFQLFYLLCVIAGVIVAIGFDQAREHRVAIVAFVAIGFNFLVEIANVAVEMAKIDWVSASTGYRFCAAGSVFMSFVFLYWIFVFGSGETSAVAVAHEQGVLPFQTPKLPSLPKLPAMQFPKISIQMPQKTQSREISVEDAPVVVTSSPTPAPAQTTPHPPPPSSTGLSFPAFPPPIQFTRSISTPPPPPVPEEKAPEPAPTPKARALYKYTASASDPNELSFRKGQEMDILNNSGKWWHVRMVNEQGEVVTGIAPSNYLEQL